MNLHIVNITGLSAISRHAKRDKVHGIMIHRCGIEDRWGHVLGYDGASIVKAFTGKGEWPAVAAAVGSKMPYGYLVGGDRGPVELDGVVWQCLPDDVVGPNARAASSRFLSVGVIADLRYKSMSPKQRASLVKLSAALRIEHDVPARMVKGHGEVLSAHDGSKAPDKSNACPGLTMAELDALRADTGAECRRIGAAVLGR